VIFGVTPGTLLLSILLGILAGVGAFTLHYAEGLSYLSRDPEACANCHIMQAQFDSWQKSSHHEVATCADCHLPSGFVRQYLAKAENGYRHSAAFTLQNFHEPIQITERNGRILQESCIECHRDFTHNLVEGSTTDPDAVRCVHCHLAAGHGEKVGLGGPESPIEKGAREL
jgi:cytochrome c nitrite reductase small subunit